jgi:hypothetical protein
MHTSEKRFSARSRFLYCCCFAVLLSAMAHGVPEMPKTEGDSLAGNASGTNSSAKSLWDKRRLPETS